MRESTAYAFFLKVTEACSSFYMRIILKTPKDLVCECTTNWTDPLDLWGLFHFLPLPAPQPPPLFYLTHPPTGASFLCLQRLCSKSLEQNLKELSMICRLWLGEGGAGGGRRSSAPPQHWKNAKGASLVNTR